MDERSEREAFEPWFQRIEDGDGEIPAPQSIADPGWSEYVQRHSIAWAAWQERARRPEPNHGPEALTAQGLLSALEADTLTGTQRAALAAMIRGREPVQEDARDGRLVFAIVYDDYDRRHEIVTDEAAARERFSRISDNWNAHLFVKVRSNSRDCSYYDWNAALASSKDSQPDADHG